MDSAQRARLMMPCGWMWDGLVAGDARWMVAGDRHRRGLDAPVHGHVRSFSARGYETEYRVTLSTNPSRPGSVRAKRRRHRSGRALRRRMADLAVPVLASAAAHVLCTAIRCRHGPG